MFQWLIWPQCSRSILNQYGANSVFFYLQSIHTIIPCVFAYDAVSYAKYLPYCTVTMSKRVESHPGLFEKCWQSQFSVQLGSCDTFAKFLLIEEDRNCQLWHPNCWGNKKIQLESNSSEKILLFSAELRSTALLCGMIHYTNSSNYHADVQLSQIIKGDQWWQPLWEHWCMNPMTTGNGNLVCWPTGRLTTPGVSRYFLWARQVREGPYQWEQGWFHAGEAKNKFHGRLPKVERKSFSNMSNKITISV